MLGNVGTVCHKMLEELLGNFWKSFFFRNCGENLLGNVKIVLGNMGEQVRKVGKACCKMWEEHVRKLGKNMLGNVGTAVRKIRICMLGNVGAAY
jgi:hypothetical protein